MAVGSVLRANRLGKKRLIKTAISPQHRGRAKPQHSLSRGSGLSTAEGVGWFVRLFWQTHSLKQLHELEYLWNACGGVFIGQRRSTVYFKMGCDSLEKCTDRSEGESLALRPPMTQFLPVTQPSWGFLVIFLLVTANATASTSIWATIRASSGLVPLYIIQSPCVSQQQGQVLCLFTLLAAKVNKQAGLQHPLHSVQLL